MIGTAPETGSRTPLAVEALGYLGGALAIVAGLVAVRQFWPDTTAADELGLAGAAAAALAVGGAVTPAGRNPAFGRLRSVLWVLSVIALAATVFCAAAVTVASAAAWLDSGLRSWGPGLAIWVLSLLWAVAVERGMLTPAWAGHLAAGAGLLLGAELAMPIAAGQALAIATVLALLAAGVVTRRGWLLVFGVIGVLQVVPQTVERYLPRFAATPLAIFVIGLALLATALWVARRHSRRGQADDGS